MDLNTPDTRQQLLAQRLAEGTEIVALDAAREFDVSLDTIRRDILALEAEGQAKRVRGGAVPLVRPASPLHQRLSENPPVAATLIRSAIDHIGDAATLVLDGGVTTLSLIAHLPRIAERLIVTPSPWVAIAAQEQGAEVFLLGGPLRPQGGIATGAVALSAMASVSADIAILGACGLDAAFGLSSDDYDESQMKIAMHRAAQRSFVVTDSSKIGQRARHRTLALDHIDLILTDATPEQITPLVAAGANIITPSA